MDSDKNIERIEQKIQELLGMDDSNEAEPLKYENKALRSVELELLEIEKKICCVERRLEKIPWTEDDKEKYGSKDYLREEKKQLREEKKQLREKEKQLREEKKQLREKENLLLKKKLSDHSPYLQYLAEFFENRFIYDGNSTTASKRSNFKPKLVDKYLEISERDYHNKNVVKNLTCQILGKELPKFLVIGSHIFKHEWAKQVQKLLGFNNINDPRNGFLLFQPIEKAFDSSRLCFIYNSEKKDFCLKILDPSLKNESILSSCKTFISAKLCGEWGSSVDEVIDIVGASLTENGKEVTFGDLEGRPLIYKGATRPYKRCLNFHASRAREQAIKMNWISENVKFKYQWSENFEDGKKMEDFLSGLRLTTSFEDPNAIFASLDDDEVLDDITPGDAIDERYDHEEGDDDAIVDEYDSNDV